MTIATVTYFPHTLLYLLALMWSPVVEVHAINAQTGHRGISIAAQDGYPRKTISSSEPHSDSHKQSIVFTSSGKQLIQRTAADPVPGGYDRTGWQMISIGDVQAITLDDGDIYAVGFDRLAVIDKGIFRQPLSTMNPYSSWTLIGYGALSSIAIHSRSAGKTMYGVGNNSWLYKQDLATMSTNNVWTVASVFSLSSIAIEGDSIYGVSPDHPGVIFTTSLKIMVEFSGWNKAGTGEVKSLTVASGTFFAIFHNNAVYNKRLRGSVDEDSWTLKDQSGMLSIAVLGDTIYGVNEDHRVYRKPLTVHKRWRQAATGPMRSLAIGPSEDMIYGVHKDGKVYKQNLLRLGITTTWEPASADGNISNIAIQGDTIYAVGKDEKVYKQPLKLMTTSSAWENASACCVSQIVVADGIVYGIGPDLRIYRQADVLMTPNSTWILASKGNYSALAIRGDTMYAVERDGFTYEQRLSSMTTASPWTPSFFEDALYPSRKYLSIMAHNDIMYACGRDMVVYSKLIRKPITYPPKLVAHRNTHAQALHWNLTDLSHTTKAPTSPPATTPRPSTTGAHLNRTINIVDKGPSTPSTTTKELVDAGISSHYVDRFQDQKFAAAGANSVNFTKLEDGVVATRLESSEIRNRSQRGASMSGFWHVVMHSLIFSLALSVLG